MREIAGRILQRFVVRVEAGVTQNKELRLRQTFPSRTEGSVKKHWYKVNSLLAL